MPRISGRISSIAESATLAVDAKAKKLKASGVDVIGFAAGEPDFPTPAHVVDAAQAAAADPRNHKYTPNAGLPELRQAIADKTARDSGLQVDPATQVIVTNGGKQAVYETFATLIDPGDEVLLPAPYWTTYPEAIRLAGGVPVPVFAGSERGYRVTTQMLEDAFTERTKVLILVSPSNPTGAVYTEHEMRILAEWAAEHDLWVISDEIYQNLVYDGSDVATSIARVAPDELADRIVLLNGVAKSYAMTGWRVGWAVGPVDVIAGAARLQSHLSSHVANVSQRAALAALTGPSEPIAAMREAFDRRRQLIVRMLQSIDGIVLPVPEGAFYAFPDVRHLLVRNWAGRTITTSVELAEVLLDEARVAVVPGEAFGAPGHLRLSYALGDEQLVEGVGRIQEFFRQS
ncbi:MAG TPA: pyridoxal phosphate-dependent aminotransferase [Pseudoclavibacter sp.]|nr:pyridoxal phosphate-dependent aminotransferase [Pseudoclavibacter sp.]